MWDVFKKIFSIDQVKIGSADLKKAAVALQYPTIKDEWRNITTQNYNKAIAAHPSKHLLGNDEKWWEMVEKQNGYYKHLNDICWVGFKTGYNFSEGDWEKIKKQLTLDMMRNT
ncbi:MAG: hypothetical protein WAV46_04190 [Candidatus Moraniibacteriota bacterium]